MKNLVSKESAIFFMILMGVSIVTMLVPEMAWAAKNDLTNLGNLLRDPDFKKIITFGLGVLAAWKWFEFFSNFNPSGAFLAIITPAVLTFLAFQWNTVLGWFGIGA